MTIFLCILTALSLSTSVKLKGVSPWAVVGLYALSTILTLGLATLAVWTWRQG